MLGLSVLPAAGQDLEAAFEEERLLLEAERDALQTELEASRRRGEAQVAHGAAVISALRDSLDTLRESGTEMETAIGQETRVLDATLVRNDLLASTLDHAREVLREHGVTPLTPEAGVGLRMTHLFAEGARVMARLGRIRAERGSYFAGDGREVDGTIIRIGTVSALGVSDTETGVLGPVGQDQLAIIDDGPAESIQRYLADGEAWLVPLYLTDPLHRTSGVRSRWSLRTFLQSGGLIVWPILGLGMIALLIVINRLVVLRRVHTNAARLTGRVLDAAEAGDYDAALSLCESRPGAVARVLETGIRHRHLSRELLDDAIHEAILDETTRLERTLPTLRVIAAVSPLLGLLGTVTGMITTFDVITEFGTGNPKLLSGGISEALVTTELGLVVAIPVLLLHNFIAGRVDDIVGDMEKSGLRLSIVLERVRETPGRGEGR